GAREQPDLRGPRGGVGADREDAVLEADRLAVLGDLPADDLIPPAHDGAGGDVDLPPAVPDEALDLVADGLRVPAAPLRPGLAVDPTPGAGAHPRTQPLLRGLGAGPGERGTGGLDHPCLETPRRAGHRPADLAGLLGSVAGRLVAALGVHLRTHAGATSPRVTTKRAPARDSGTSSGTAAVIRTCSQSAMRVA